jgi:hypothetical protein
MLTIGTNSTVVRDALIATTAGTTLNVTASSGLSPSPVAFTAYSAPSGFVAGNNGPTAGGMYGAFIYVQNPIVMVTSGNTVIAINNSPAAVSYQLASSSILANNFGLYFNSSVDADAAAALMTPGKAFTYWDSMGNKYVGTLGSMITHTAGNTYVGGSFSSSPTFTSMDMSHTHYITIG